MPAKVSMTSFNCLAVSQLQTIFTPFHKYNKATMQIYGTRKNINNSYTLFALSSALSMLQPSYAVASFRGALKILYWVWRNTYKIIYQCTVLECFFLPFDSGEVSTVYNQSFSVAIMFELRTRIKTDCTDRPSYFDIEV